MPSPEASNVTTIAIDKIHVLNPRVRNRKVFRGIESSIGAVGLKRPITVAVRRRPEGTEYDLVCGQGRLEAYQSLGQSSIPALIIEAEVEDCLVMSLVENVARRQHKAIDLLHDVEGMQLRGHSEEEIATKAGLTVEYVRSVLKLMGAKEQRLLRAVESGHLPVSIAVAIAGAEDEDVQVVLQQAYEQRLLRGNRLIEAKRLVESRRAKGKSLRPSVPYRERSLSPAGLLRTYRESAERKRTLVRKADAARARLAFVTEALRTLMRDEDFSAILKLEGLESLPLPLGERVRAQPTVST
jgi:ParB family transcriptional regulator, chromosome partitioning protein